MKINEMVRPQWEIEEQYAYGDCDILALALHRKFNLPIKAVVSNDSTYSHVWVDKDGKALDIWGLRPEQEIKTAWIDDDNIDATIKSVSEEWLLNNLPNRQRHNLDDRINQALKDFKSIHPL